MQGEITNSSRQQGGTHEEFYQSGIRGLSGDAAVSADSVPLETGRAVGGEVPADRYPHFQLPGERYQSDLPVDAV